MRFPEDEESALDMQADAEGRSKNEVLRDAFKQYLARNRTWPEPLLTDDQTFDLGGSISKQDIRGRR